MTFTAENIMNAVGIETDSERAERLEKERLQKARESVLSNEFWSTSHEYLTQKIVNNLFKTGEKWDPNSLSAESNLFSEEVYFGQKHPFSTEMMKLVGDLREELRELLGGEWADPNKYKIIIKNAVDPKNKTRTKFKEILSQIERCIEKYCNIEKCYIGVECDINAHTIPMVWDSSVIFNDLKDLVAGRYIKESKIRSYADIERKLMTLEDICLNKDGWRFKEAKGKVFIISIGIPLIVSNNFESSNECICGVIFHEIGHNFQQVLRGCNQMIVDSLIRYYLMISNAMNTPVAVAERAISKLVKDTTVSPEKRYQLIRSLIYEWSTQFKRDPDGSISAVSRDDVGNQYKKGIDDTLDYKNRPLGFGWKVVFKILTSLNKAINLIFAPLTSLLYTSKRNKYDKSFGQLIKENKQYEQFADAFAVSYGFDISTFHKSIEKLYSKLHQDIGPIQLLNHIPFLSQCYLMTQIRETQFGTNCGGYDIGSGRIANMYQSLKHELQSNPDLKPDQKKEIMANIEKAKAAFEEVQITEIKRATGVKSSRLISKLLKKLDSGDIDKVADETGFTKLVLETVDEYEKTGLIKEPEVVADFKKANDLSKDGKSKFASMFNGIAGFFRKTFGIDEKDIEI